MLNKAILMGRLTADPELKHTPENTPVTSFTLAVNRTFGQDQQADFIDIVAWRNTAELVCKWFCKGMQMAVCGRIQTRTWEDKQGNKRKSVEVVANEVYFVDWKKMSKILWKKGNRNGSENSRSINPSLGSGIHSTAGRAGWTKKHDGW